MKRDCEKSNQLRLNNVVLNETLNYKKKQEVKESFASPDYVFYGKSHIVKQLYRKNGYKKPFLFAFNTTTRGN